MLPDGELKRLASLRGSRVTAVRLCAMRDCEEEFCERPGSGLFCLTWGVVLTFEGGTLEISWGDDADGDPFRIALGNPGGFARVETLIQQDVSTVPPWTRYIDSVFDSYEVLAYDSNYARHPSDSTWHSVPWGLLLRIGPHRLLAAAACHEDPFSGAPCGDKLVVAYSDDAIRRLCEARAGERSEWGEG